jgi:large subunit ribosomal protein L11
VAAKKIKKVIKLQLPAAKATPAGKVGTVLGPAGINLMNFIKEFNDRTAKQEGNVLPVEISVFEDSSFTFVTKQPPVPDLIKKAIGLAKGSGEPNKTKVGKLSGEQLKSIAEAKMPDLNAANIEAAQRIIAGTARSMGVTVEG